MKKVSVLICAYTEDRWQELNEAVESVRRQTVPIFEIILVIDHNPALYERARSGIDGVTVIQNLEKRGLSGARNQGIRQAQGDIVAFLDDDATARPDWIEHLLVYMQDENVLGAGGAADPFWDNDKPSWFPAEFNWVVGCSYLGLPETAGPVRNPLGGCMAWCKDLFEKAGYFCTDLGRVGKNPAGCEETEMCIRARQAFPGKIFIYEPRSRILHHVPARRARFSYFRARCYSEGLSKAAMVRLVGNGSGLSSERTYTMKTLPKGVLRGVTDALRGDFSGLARSAAIVCGLAFTGSGYIFGTLWLRLHPQAKPKAAAQPSQQVFE